MLVLTRRVDETIEIGEDITITVVQINTRQVRIAIEAPGKDIWRGEIADERRAAKKGARL